MPSDPPAATARQFVRELVHVAAEREIGQAQHVAFGIVRADRVDRIVVELLRRVRRGVEIERELLQFLRDDRLVVRRGAGDPGGDGGADLETEAGGQDPSPSARRPAPSGT